MNYSTKDTDWAKSSKGNYWRRFSGKVIVVGTKDKKFYWAMIDGDFLNGQFMTKEAAQKAADIEAGAKKEDDSIWGMYD